MTKLIALAQLVLILTVVAAHARGPIPVSAIEAMVAATRSESGLVHLQAVLSDGKQAGKLAGFLRAAKLAESEIQLALQSPTAARGAILRALGEARNSQALRNDAAAILGTDLKFTELAQSLKAQQQATPTRTVQVQPRSPFQAAGTAPKISLTRPAASRAAVSPQLDHAIELGARSDLVAHMRDKHMDVLGGAFWDKCATELTAGVQYDILLESADAGIHGGRTALEATYGRLAGQDPKKFCNLFANVPGAACPAVDARAVGCL